MTKRFELLFTAGVSLVDHDNIEAGGPLLKEDSYTVASCRLARSTVANEIYPVPVIAESCRIEYDFTHIRALLRSAITAVRNVRSASCTGPCVQEYTHPALNVRFCSAEHVSWIWWISEDSGGTVECAGPKEYHSAIRGLVPNSHQLITQGQVYSTTARIHFPR